MENTWTQGDINNERIGKMHDVELHKLCSLLSIVMILKLLRMLLLGKVAQLVEIHTKLWFQN